MIPVNEYIKSIYWDCPHCESFEADVVLSGPHYKLLCAKCRRFLKFISKSTLENCTKVADRTEEITLETINFKLDLIIDHLGINKEEDNGQENT